MRIWPCLLIAYIISGAASDAWAVAIPILDPGFDIYIANTLNLVPDNRLPNQGSPGAGGGPITGVGLLNFDTFGPAGMGDIPAGWIATGQKPSGAANTGRIRCDDCFLDDSGTMASINSSHDESDPTTQGKFSQTLSGVLVQPRTLYKATVEVSDLDIRNHGPFMPSDDNLVLGDPARIVLSLSAQASPTEIVDLGGTLEFSPITPGGFGTAADRISGGKELLTLTVTTGDTVPAGDLTISFTSAGVFGDLPSTFAASAQTFFDNVGLDATPLNVGHAGDYNSDGNVDAADYVLWRNTNINGAQGYADWRANFGSLSSVGGGITNTGVPEPAAVAVLFLAAAQIVLGGRLRSHLRANKMVKVVRSIIVA
jgi:hypothetical protein